MTSSDGTTSSRPQDAATSLVTAGRDTKAQKGFVNPPVFHGSTVLYPTAEDLHAHRAEFTYGRHGSPTTRALQDVLMAMEGPQCAGVGLAPSGLAAISTTLLAVLKAGDHLLVCDNAYRPTRNFCDRFLKRMGVETTYYDPGLGAGIAALIRSNTRVIFLETPGSQTFEIQDVPAIAGVAIEKDLCTILDNTWATPLFFPPHRFGIDLAIEAGTKYLSGHADLLLGLVSANERWLPRLRASFDLFANCPGPEDVYLALRGLRTLELRLREAERQGLALATWLSARPEVARVLHPALPDCPGHAIWRRDFRGSSGLCSVFLKPVSQPALAAFLDGLSLFGMGYSWGGYESLVIPFDCSTYRTATTFAPPGPALRFSIGLEDPEDLKADLAAGFERLKIASQ